MKRSRNRDRTDLAIEKRARPPAINFVLRGPFDRFAAIEARVVAAAMAELVGQAETGCHIHHNNDIRRLARGAG